MYLQLWSNRMNLLAIAESSSNSNSSFLAWTLIAALGLVFIHLFAANLEFIEVIPRSKWLSLAGGASIAYIFVHVLPELQEGQQKFAENGPLFFAFLEHHIYLISLIGFIVFYGLEKLALISRQKNQEMNKEYVTEEDVFWVHITSFSIYNALIGYLLVHREENGLWNLSIFFLAMALHFFVNDHGLREHHKHQYKYIGRWILASAIFGGWIIGQATNISESVIAMVFAFVAGGVVLNVIKEELPEERQSNFWAFFIGAFLYTTLLLID
ncbi:MAG: hypothetical protein ACOC0N_08085 [Chroococcales cyanobacterium]